MSGCGPLLPCEHAVPAPLLLCSKFESDGALNDSFREGAFELPVERISGAERFAPPLPTCQHCCV